MWLISAVLCLYISGVPKKPAHSKSQENQALLPLRLATDLFEPIGSLGCAQCSSSPVMLVFVVKGIEPTRNMWACILLWLAMPSLRHDSGLRDADHCLP